MIHATAAEIETRARRVADHLRARTSARVSLADGESTVGGGSAPGSRLRTRLLAVVVDGIGADDLSARLRRGAPPVVARIEADRVVLDLRTVRPDEDQQLADALVTAIGTA
jgi:L-seryl-tRNA(Ser) seleniumtransferase